MAIVAQETPPLNLTLPIPDDLARRPGAGELELARRALEAFAVVEYRAGHLSARAAPAARLGDQRRAAELERDRHDLDRLGL